MAMVHWLALNWWFLVENMNDSLSLSVSCMLGRWPAKGEPHLLPSISSDRLQPAATNDTELDKRLEKSMSEKLGLTHPMGLWWFIIISCLMLHLILPWSGITILQLTGRIIANNVQHYLRNMSTVSVYRCFTKYRAASSDARRRPMPW